MGSDEAFDTPHRTRAQEISASSPRVTAPANTIPRLQASKNVLEEIAVRAIIQEALVHRFGPIKEGIACIPAYDSFALRLHAAANVMDTPAAKYVAAESAMSSYKCFLPLVPRF